MSLEDEELSEPPKRATIPKMVAKVHDIVLYDRSIKVDEIAKTVDISLCSLMNQSVSRTPYYIKQVVPRVCMRIIIIVVPKRLFISQFISFRRNKHITKQT